MVLSGLECNVCSTLDDAGDLVRYCAWEWQAFWRTVVPFDHLLQSPWQQATIEISLGIWHCSKLQKYISGWLACFSPLQLFLLPRLESITFQKSNSSNLTFIHKAEKREVVTVFIWSVWESRTLADFTCWLWQYLSNFKPGTYDSACPIVDAQ